VCITNHSTPHYSVTHHVLEIIAHHVLGFELLTYYKYSHHHSLIFSPCTTPPNSCPLHCSSDTTLLGINLCKITEYHGEDLERINLNFLESYTSFPSTITPSDWASASNTAVECLFLALSLFNSNITRDIYIAIHSYLTLIFPYWLKSNPDTIQTQ